MATVSQLVGGLFAAAYLQKHRLRPAGGQSAATRVTTVPLEFLPEKVLGIVTFKPYLFGGEIKRHPEVEVLLVPGDSRTEALRKVSGGLTE